MKRLDYFLHDDPDLPLAWGPWFTHEYLHYFSARAVGALMNAPPVLVLANPQYGQKLWPTGPRHIDLYKESYTERRALHPLDAYDYKKRNGDYAQSVPAGKTIEPWKILVIYATEPDLYLDDSLKLHKNQSVAGGSHGWRHMYFKILGSTYGIAPQSFRFHRDMASLCFENGNNYWGWRELSRAAHYLADMGNPFHVKTLPGSFLIRKIFARRQFFRIIAAIHHSYEIYVERRLREGDWPFGEALVQGAREAQVTDVDIDASLRDYIKRARQKHDVIFYHFYNQFGEELLDVFLQIDPNSPVEATTQTNRLSADAAKVLFRRENLYKLEYLDILTGNMLHDVGKMLGALFKRFSS